MKNDATNNSPKITLEDIEVLLKEGFEMINRHFDKIDRKTKRMVARLENQ